MSEKSDLNFPQIKICGLTSVDEAVACAEFGASAIGCVFYPPSPRFVDEERARDICRSLPSGVFGTGVFVNEGFSEIMGRVERCGLRVVQLHGQESEELVEKLTEEGLIVIKALFLNGEPSIASAESCRASAFLVECAGGVLPGGNAKVWDWGAAAGLSLRRPTVLAGGLDAGNVGDALRLASPDAVDVSSGVEAKPGVKDLGKVKSFIEAVRRTGSSRIPRRIFS
jgi:phosphoribosylanthranilate isomerase